MVTWQKHYMSINSLLSFGLQLLLQILLNCTTISFDLLFLISHLKNLLIDRLPKTSISLCWLGWIKNKKVENSYLLVAVVSQKHLCKSQCSAVCTPKYKYYAPTNLQRPVGLVIKWWLRYKGRWKVKRIGRRLIGRESFGWKVWLYRAFGSKVFTPLPDYLTYQIHFESVWLYSVECRLQ